MNLFLFFENGRYITFKLTSEYSYHVFDTTVMVDSICGIFYFPIHTIKYILILTDLQLKDRENVKWCLNKLNGKPDNILEEGDHNEYPNQFYFK